MKSLALEEGGSIGVGGCYGVIAGAVDWEREEPNLNRVWHSENRVHCYGIPERERERESHYLIYPFRERKRSEINRERSEY